MGYTGAVFSRFFGSGLGVGISLTCLMLWIAIPAWRSYKTFMNKDF
jgi:Cu-processing system permease protein